MMSTYLKVAVIAVTAALAAVTVKKTNPDFGMLVGICGCGAAAFLILELARPVIDFSADLVSVASMEDSLLSPLLKTVGVGLLTQISSAVCTDAGEAALAKLAELGGSILCVCVSLPLMSEVLKLIQEMIGG